MITGAELSSSPARSEVRAGKGRGVATAPAAAPATVLRVVRESERE